MGLTQSKPISTDPKIIDKPVWHVWTVKTCFLQGTSMQTSVTAGRDKYEAVFISKILFTVQIQLCLLVIQLCLFVIHLCLLVIQLSPFVINYVVLSFNYVRLSFTYVWL